MDYLFLNFFNDNDFRRNWSSYVIYGALFIVSGLIILFFPEILVALIATIFFTIGIFIIAIAFHIRRKYDKLNRAQIRIND